MTLRAFIVGLLLVVFMCWADVWAGISRRFGWVTEGHFPEACAFLLVVLTLGVNVVIKLVRRSAGFKQAELMLVWCMLIVAAVFPTTGLFRLWFPMLAGPAYFAGKPDALWRDTALQAAPEALLVSKNPASVVVRRFYEGAGPEARVPWDYWLAPMARWLILLLLFYFAIFFLCAIFRKQWVEREHLLFPLARVPLDFTEDSGSERLLPSIFAHRAFVIGLTATVVFRLLRAIPVFAGATEPWNVRLPLEDALRGTPLQELYMVNVDLWWPAIGFAYLVPVDVSLSVWLFYLFGRAELQTAAWIGSPLHYGGTWSELMLWQQAGAYMAFTIGALYMTRRHLRDVAKVAFSPRRAMDDSAEPVSFRIAFWGLTLCFAGAVGWCVWHGMAVWAAGVFLLMLMCVQLVHARLVSQSGLYWTWLVWSPPDVLHSLSLGHALGRAGAVVAHMQRGIMLHNVSLSPAAMQCFRIGEVFKKHRRLLLPVMAVALVAALAVCSWTFLNEAYTRGVLNFEDEWGNISNPQDEFWAAHHTIEHPRLTAQPRWVPFGLGALLTGFVMLMRAHFYWWPIHAIGLLAISNWSADRMWLPFLLGWLTKVSLMKLGGGRMLRRAHFFFIGLILAESSMQVVSTIVRAISGGTMAGF